MVQSRCVAFLLITIVILFMSLPATGFTQAADQSSSLVGKQPLEYLLKQYLGIPYRRGGLTKKGMDCSGFVRTVYRRIFGVELPHNSRDQYRCTDLKKVATNRLQTGDLLFFARKKKVNHVGIYLGNNRFIHASSSVGITISSLNEGYWKKRFIGSKRSLLPFGPDSAPAHEGSPEKDDFAAAFLPLADATLSGS